MTETTKDTPTVMAPLSTKKRDVERQPITEERKATLQLHTLPKEILLEIFRYLLLLPFDYSRVAQEIQLKIPPFTLSAPQQRMCCA